jgi:hypothetical protein
MSRSPGHHAKYGARHQALRARLAPKVAAGVVDCARCGERIDAWESWDLDHRDDGHGYLGASHATCNRATNKRAPVDLAAYPEDDPANGIYYGPPESWTNEPRRWSRPWIEWRAEREGR